MSGISKVYSTLEKVYRAINKICDTISATMIAFCILVTVANVLARVFFKSPFKGAIEMIQYTMFTAVCFALAPCNDNKGHIKVDLMLEVLPPKVVNVLEIIVGIISMIGFTLFGRYMFSVAKARAAMGQILATLGIKVSIFYWILGIALIVLAVSVFFGVIDSFISLFSRKQEETVPAEAEQAITKGEEK